MLKILRYSIYDLMRSRWTYIYFAFYLMLSFGLMMMSRDLTKVIVSLMNVVLVIVPLIATMFSVMYHYNSREFTQLLLAQPIPRRSIFLGQYLGIAISLAVSTVLGLLIPFLVYGLFQSTEIWNFLALIVVSIFLSFIFSAIAFYIALCNENRIRGFGWAVFVWLFFAVIYDGLFLLLLSMYGAYNLENFTLGMTMFNPIDLSRVLILLKLDISALMGYTGAVISKFLGNSTGMIGTFLILILWILIPVWRMTSVALKKDF